MAAGNSPFFFVSVVVSQFSLKPNPCLTIKAAVGGFLHL
jgi:hypothetical protein